MIFILPGACELESLNAEIKRKTFEEGYMTEEDYPFTIKPFFSRVDSIKEIERGRGWQVSFVQDDTFSDLLGFKPKFFHDEYKLSDHPVDILSFENSFLETDIAQGLICKGKRTGIIHYS